MKGALILVYKKTLICIFCSLITLGFSPAQAKDVQDAGDVADNLSDVLIYMAPTFAVGMTLGKKDWQGTWQFTQSAVSAMGVVVVLKYTVDEKRPNGGDQSFPSGHTAIMAVSADFVRRRYGWKISAPLYVLTGFVGYDRVRTDDHYPHDSVAGFAIGIVGAYLFTDRYSPQVEIKPEVKKDFRGIRLTYAF